MDEEDAIAMLGALSQETRLRIIRYLIGRGDEGASAGEIAEAMRVISSKASFHLSALERAGLITSERQSRKIIYRVSFPRAGWASLVYSQRLLQQSPRHPRTLRPARL